ncbi:Copia protein [Ceratobasidium sp. AG-Ba]|nr:Copia protein [Ceratobasidium sp. AG-Ba]
MFEETELWPIINKSEPLPGPTQGTSSTGTATTTQPSQTDINNWNKRNCQALGMIRRRIESAPMTHIACCTNSFEAWDVLAQLYQSIGSGAMILLCNRFSNLHMSEGDNLEEHIKKLRKVFDELNIALLAEGSSTIKELEFIRQLLASLPESWQIIVSIINQTPDATDPDGITLSQNIQSRLLNEYQRRRIATGEVAMYIKPKRASDRLTISCNNCGLKGHIIDECYKPGGLAYKGKNSNIQGRGRGKKRGGYQNKGNRGNQERPRKKRNQQNNNSNQGNQQANFAEDIPHTAFSFNMPEIEKLIDDMKNVFIPPEAYQATQYSFGINNAWILDSGASCHIANQERYLSNYMPIENVVQGIGGKANISGISELTLKVGTEIPEVKKSTKEVILKGDTWTQITLSNAACVKESPVNLISISAWTNQFPHHEMITKGDKIKILDNNKFLALGQKLGERKSGNCWYLVATVDLAQHAFLTRTIQDWHMILGHTDPNNI